MSRTKEQPQENEMHDIQKPITLEDLTNPDKINTNENFTKRTSLLRKNLALKNNLKKEKIQEKYKIQKRENNDVLSDKWIRKMSKHIK